MKVGHAYRDWRHFHRPAWGGIHRTKYLCPDCLRVFKREGARKDVTCHACGASCFDAGPKFRPPPRAAKAAWVRTLAHFRRTKRVNTHRPLLNRLWYPRVISAL